MCELCKGTGKVRVLNRSEGVEDDEGNVIYSSPVYTDSRTPEYIPCPVCSAPPGPLTKKVQ